MKCSLCGNELPAGATVCPACGGKVDNPAPAPGTQIVMSEKNRTSYALLGFFLGNLGVHDFYIGRPGRAITNIIGNILISPFLVQISTGIELLTNQKDGKDRVLQGSSSVPVILGILLIVINLILSIIAVIIFIGFMMAQN